MNIMNFDCVTNGEAAMITLQISASSGFDSAGEKVFRNIYIRPVAMAITIADEFSKLSAFMLSTRMRIGVAKIEILSRQVRH